LHLPAVFDTPSDVRNFRHRVLFVTAVCTGVLACLFTACSPPEPDQPPEQTHSIKLTDPLKPQEPARMFRIKPIVDSDGMPCGYSMRLITDVCLDNTCDILDITIYWDLFGRYERFEYPPGRPLTKMNHEPFSEEDYTFLDRILSNRDSILKIYSIDWFMEQQSDEVDAVSGATAENVDSEVVEGAVYTSWVLWHWVNGEAVERLRTLTWISSPAERLNDWLSRGDPEQVEYVLDLLQQDKTEPKEKLRESLLVALRNATYRTAKNILLYLQETAADRETLNIQLATIAGRAEDLPQREIMDYLNRQPNVSPAVLQIVSSQLTTMSYAGVHIALNLFERVDNLPPDAEQNVRKLVESDNPFIVRRAKEYLEKNRRS
jgi:hypothetical protein